MTSSLAPLFSRRALHLLTAAALNIVLLAIAAPAPAEPKAAPKSEARRTVPVVMLSDIHFDPFSQPSKVPELRSAPISEWPKILATAPAASDAADFTALQRTCRVRGLDTDWNLFRASLIAAHAQQPSPLFVTLSGDLMAHGFDCKFHQLAPSTSEADYSSFAAKTVSFVAVMLHDTFPRSPVYMALGNNDSGCADYHETPGSPYLRISGESIASDMPAEDRLSVQTSFARQGDYSVNLPRPMQGTRLIVLQDIFQSRRYKACPAGQDAHAAEQQIAWLREQLTSARDHHQRVWVMAHIPPGVDVYSTLIRGANVCAGQTPEMFLNSDALTRTLTEFASTIRFVLLAHSHMDEMRLLHAGELSAGGTDHSAHPRDAVPAKLVPSISPINGNNPAFTVAQVDPRSATLVDYEVYAADNTTGVDTHWAEEYRYSAAYHQPDFSAASVANLLGTMRDDKTAADPSTGNYARWFFAGDSGVHALALRLVWPSYSCALTETTEAGYRSCVCPAKPPAATETPAATPPPAPADTGKPAPHQ